MGHGDALPEQSTTPAQRRRWDLDRALMMRWQAADTAPKDGTHILVCSGPYDEFTGFNQKPPQVVHFFADPEQPGFYPSHGIVQDSYNDRPVEFSLWSPLGHEPRGLSIWPQHLGPYV